MFQQLINQNHFQSVTNVLSHE